MGLCVYLDFSLPQPELDYLQITEVIICLDRENMNVDKLTGPVEIYPTITKPRVGFSQSWCVVSLSLSFTLEICSKVGRQQRYFPFKKVARNPR